MGGEELGGEDQEERKQNGNGREGWERRIRRSRKRDEFWTTKYLNYVHIELFSV